MPRTFYYVGEPLQGVSGTEYAGTGAPQTVTGTYTLTDAGGGTQSTSPLSISAIKLTAPATQTYAIYVIDTTGCTGQEISCELLDFLGIDIDASNTNPSIIFAHQ